MIGSLKILHFENEDVSARLLREELKKTDFISDYLRVKDRPQFERELIRFAPDIVFSNYDLLQQVPVRNFPVSRQSQKPYTLILIAHTYSEVIARQMAQSGASDFLFKDRLERLPLVILNAVKKSMSEKALQEQHAEVIDVEKKSQTLIENISDAILLLDIKGSITYHSPSAERLSGFPSAEAIGKSIFEFIHPADLETVTRYLKQAILKPGVSLTTSYRLRQKRSSFIWAEGTITNFIHDATIKAIIFTYRNITERKFSEERLQKSEANLRTIFDNTTVSYVLSDRNFKVISFNSSASYTYSKEFKVEIKEGDSLLDYIPDERKPPSRDRFEKALRGDKVTYELSFLQPAGGFHWYNVNMFAVRDDSQNLLGFIIASENITKRKIIELERNKMLTDIVQHNKDLEQFAYIISHNLRSPVANILGLSALIENSPDMDKVSFEKCMAGLTLSVKKLDNVIVDLNYILQTRREINEKKESVSFSEIINDIKTSISGIIEKENILINTNFTFNKFFTLKSYLYSIFFNLIYNSIKYRNPNNRTVIDVQSKRVNNKLIIEFRDNGLGIDLNAHGNNVFGLYKKFHKHVEGKGMGLYMVKTQVEILGGKISVASEVNKGTTFVLEFQE
ncbi:hypothetical protein CNR22_13085 [Sphingobacteriaceae bacterium]|nr:hypothetical protein CNR22_13085 [Sphingobacteriaceae bacterium]